MKRHVNKALVVFLSATAILTLVGIAIITNASIPLSQKNFGESFYYFRHQILYGLGLGLLAFFVFSKIRYGRLKKIALVVLVAALILLALVFMPEVGYEAGGARRWINVLGFSFQPSEFAKLALVIYLAHWLESKKDKLARPMLVFPLLFWLGITGGLILAEPDYGTFLVISAAAFIMYFSAGAKPKIILAVGLASVLILSLLMAAEPYRRQRLVAFFSPEKDTAGKSYQLNQALIAIGSGGFGGLGLGKGIQKYNYLPETIGDAIFAITSEELGFAGASVVLLAYVAWILSGLKIAAMAAHVYGRNLAVGIVSWIGLQTSINMLGILGLIPFSGIPLPFISYGSSALVIELAAVGIVANIAKNR